MKTENRKRMSNVVLTILMTATVVLGVIMFTPVKAEAAGKFDPAFYAATYPDVAAAVGMDVNALYAHYVSCGRLEDRLPYAGAEGGELVDGIAGLDAAAAALPGVVPLSELPHYNDIKDTMTDAEFVELYNNMAPWMQLVQMLEKAEQVIFVEELLADALIEGDVVYTNITPYYSNAYGFFYYGGADAGGCTRTAGLMFEMLGIEWEHVVAGYDTMVLHHWSVVTIDGQRYIVDPCMDILMPEESRYSHPAVDEIMNSQAA